MALVKFPSGAVAPNPDDPDDDRLDDDGAGGKMSFLEHLDELRKRIIISVYGLVAGCVVSFIFVNHTERFILEPLHQMMPRRAAPRLHGADRRLHDDDEDWRARRPLHRSANHHPAALALHRAGLYSNEKRFAIPFVLFGTFFFVAGAAFSHYVAFPYSWKFFLGFENAYIQFLPKLSEAFSLWVKMLLGFGVIFQMPTIVFFLARMGMVTAGFLIKHFKCAVLIIFILGAVLSPGTDVVSQALMAGPMLLLYFLSIGIAWLFAKKRVASED